MGKKVVTLENKLRARNYYFFLQIAVSHGLLEQTSNLKAEKKTHSMQT